MHQRVQVLNTYITNKINYHGLMLPLPTKYAKQLEQQVRRFLFHGKIAMGKLRLDGGRIGASRCKKAM